MCRTSYEPTVVSQQFGIITELLNQTEHKTLSLLIMVLH